MAYFTYDEGGSREHATLQAAIDDATESIKYARQLCDPEWPMNTGDISVYEAPSGSEYPDEEGTLLYRATEVDVRDAEEGDSVEYYCDYKMLPVAAPTEEAAQSLDDTTRAVLDRAERIVAGQSQQEQRTTEIFLRPTEGEA